MSVPTYTMETSEAHRMVPFATRFVSSLDVTRPLRVSSTAEGVWLETRSPGAGASESSDAQQSSTTTTSSGTGVSTTYRTTAHFLVGPLVPKPAVAGGTAAADDEGMNYKINEGTGPDDSVDGLSHEPREGENDGEYGQYTLRVVPLPGIDYGDFNF